MVRPPIEYEFDCPSTPEDRPSPPRYRTPSSEDTTPTKDGKQSSSGSSTRIDSSPPSVKTLEEDETLKLVYDRKLIQLCQNSLSFLPSSVSAENLRKLFLGNARRVPSKDGKSKWIELPRTITTELVCKWFDCQLNDYHKKTDFIADAVTQNWIGHGGSSPRDWRARPFLLRFNEAVVGPAEQRIAKNNKWVIARATFICAGRHNMKPKSDDQSTLHRQGKSRKPANSTKPATAPKKKGQHDWNKCTGAKGHNVQIMMEVTADDVDRVHIYQYGTHKDTDLETQKLQKSRRLRNLIEERFFNQGGTHSAKVSAIQLYITRVGELDGWEYPIPPDRIHEKKDIQSMHPSARARFRLDADPIVAMHKLVGKEPEKTYFYRQINRKRTFKNSSFTCGFKDGFTLDSLIMYALKNGIGLDSCWRHKNENRAPMTMIITVDDHNHFVPGAVLLSANVKEDTLVGWIEDTVRVILERCRILVEAADSGESHPSVRLPIINPRPNAPGSSQQPFSRYDKGTERERLVENARKILAGGFKPSHIMTDKSLTQINALLRVFPDIPIRICQFHVIQALNRWSRDDGKRVKGPRLSEKQQAQFAAAFRVVQRSRTVQEVTQRKEVLFSRVKDIVYGRSVSFEAPTDEDLKEVEKQRGEAVADDPEEELEEEDQAVDGDESDDEEAGDDDYEDYEDEGAEEMDDPYGNDGLNDLDDDDATPEQKRAVRFIFKYLDKCWFTDLLIPMFTDVGMPPDQTRDGTWNTNNWIESAFKVFDQVFLDSRRNKRIDRLAMIIVYDFFPFYARWRSSGTPQLRRDLISASWRGHRTWEKGLITVYPGRKYLIHPLSKLELTDDPVDVIEPTPDSQGKKYLINMTLGARCSCTYHTQSGRSCQHIQAARLQDRLGASSEWKAEEAESSRKGLKGPKNMRYNGGMPTDLATDDADERVRLALDVLDSRLKVPTLEMDSDSESEGGMDVDSDGGMKDFVPQGRPAKVKPLQKGRGSKKRKACSKKLSKEEKMFNNPPGPAKKERLKNSLFSVNAQGATQPSSSIQTRSKATVDPASSKNPGGKTTAATVPVSSSKPTKPAGPAEKAALPSPSDYISVDEATMFGVDCSRWGGSWMMRAEEMQVFVDIKNAISDVLDRPFLFVYDTHGLSESLRWLDWGVAPGSDDDEEKLLALITDPKDRDRLKTGLLLQAYRRHKRSKFTHIVFMHLNVRAVHWTAVVHDLQAPRANAVHVINSLKCDTRLNLSEQNAFAEFFRLDRSREIPSSTFCHGFKSVNLDVQKDGTSCGFWASFAGFGLLLGIYGNGVEHMNAPLDDVKDALASLYSAYCGGGVRRSTLELAFKLSPLEKLGSSEADPMVAPNLNPRVADAQAEEVKIYEENLAFCQDVLQVWDTAGTIKVGTRDVALEFLRPCMEDDTMLGVDIFNAAMDALVEHPLGATTAPEYRINGALVLSLELSETIMTVGGVRQETLRPKGGRRGWFSDGINVFDGTYQRIIVPIYRPAEELNVVDGQPDSEWSVAHVDLSTHEIDVFTPWKVIPRTYNTIRQRIHKMLAFEHRRELNLPLGEEWNLPPAPVPPKSTSQAKKKQKEDTRIGHGAAATHPQDYGFWALEYIRMLLLGIPPWQSNWSSHFMARQRLRLQPVLLIGSRWEATERAGAAGTGSGSQESPVTIDETCQTPSLSQEAGEKMVAILKDHTRWLSDTCIREYLICLRTQAAAGIHIFDPLFYTRLTSPETFDAATSWNKSVPLFSLDRLIIIINHGNSHWATACIYMKEKKKEYFDSSPGLADVVEVGKVLDRFLQARALQEDAEHLGLYRAEEWTKGMHVPEGVPEQDDLIQCGVYASAFAECLAMGGKPMQASGFLLDGKGAVSYRIRMLNVIQNTGRVPSPQLDKSGPRLSAVPLPKDPTQAITMPPSMSSITADLNQRGVLGNTGGSSPLDVDGSPLNLDGWPLMSISPIVPNPLPTTTNEYGEQRAAPWVTPLAGLDESNRGVARIGLGISLPTSVVHVGIHPRLLGKRAGVEGEGSPQPGQEEHASKRLRLSDLHDAPAFDPPPVATPDTATIHRRSAPPISPVHPNLPSTPPTPISNAPRSRQSTVHIAVAPLTPTAPTVRTLNRGDGKRLIKCTQGSAQTLMDNGEWRLD